MLGLASDALAKIDASGGARYKRYANSWIKRLTPRRTTLHLTSRLVELLDEHQLEAVIAHELSHVGQKDPALMSAVGAPVAAMLDGAGLYFHTPMAVLRTIRAATRPGPTPGKPGGTLRRCAEVLPAEPPKRSVAEPRRSLDRPVG
jgi:hypothetical protein